MVCATEQQEAVSLFVAYQTQVFAHAVEWQRMRGSKAVQYPADRTLSVLRENRQSRRTRVRRDRSQQEEMDLSLWDLVVLREVSPEHEGKHIDSTYDG